MIKKSVVTTSILVFLQTLGTLLIYVGSQREAWCTTFSVHKTPCSCG